MTAARMHVPFVDLAAQYATIRPDVDRAWRAVLTEGQFVLGSRVDGFEREFARFIAADHAVGVASGLDALRLALTALGVGPGDEVVLPANSYIATALAVSHVGATPVLVDCQPGTLVIDPGHVEAAITDRTRAIVPVHFAGQAADLRAILASATRRGIYVVEDAAQAHGTMLQGRRCGSIGIVGCFSFYPSKNLGAYGDGGMATTSDPALAQRLRRLRNYGERAKYEHVVRGLNSRLDEVQAAVLAVKLRRLEGWNEARRAHADEYRALLDGVGDLAWQRRVANSSHIYHLLLVETDVRDALREHLAEQGVQTGIHYPKPIHLQDAYAELGWRAGAFPESERVAARTLSLPMYPELTSAQVEYVAGAVREFFRKRGLHRDPVLAATPLSSVGRRRRPATRRVSRVRDV
jgi:dTDP-4-amino-4,6-dideoxygalactose transaminase